MKKVLITGNSGYIGSHLTKFLKNIGYEIYGIDIENSIIAVDDFRKIDIRENFNCYKNLIFDAVIHLAAKVNVAESVRDPANYYITNIVGTNNILKKIRYNNFIFASTGGVNNLANPYTISKKAAEDMIQTYCKNYTIFRFFNVAGSEGVVPTNDGLYANLCQAVKTKTFDLYGTDYNTTDGTCIRDFLHVNEICWAIAKALDFPANNIENLGHGQGYSILEIIDIFKKTNNVDFEVKLCNRRSGDIESSVLNNVSSYMNIRYSIEEIFKL